MKRILAVLMILVVTSAFASKWMTDLILEDGKLQLKEVTVPATVAGYGSFYSSSVDNDPHWVDSSGNDSNLLLGGTSVIDDLADVTIVTPLLNQVLTFNGAGQWINQVATGGSVYITINDTTANVLDTALVVSDGTNTTNILEKTVLDPAADETLQLQIDSTKITTLGSVEEIQYNITPTPSATTEGLTYWNTTDKTLNLDTGEGPVLQVGQEIFIRVHNSTASPIVSGKAVYPVSISGSIASVALAQSDTHATLGNTIFITTDTIAAGGIGFCARLGKVRGVDTSAWSIGTQLWVSPDVAGDLTDVKPEFPDYVAPIGTVLVAAVDGTIGLAIDSDIHQTLQSAWNGTIRESFDFRVTSDGATVTGALSPSNGHPDLTLIFSDGFSTFTATPDATTPLTPGTDINPQTNYIYILESSKVLTVSLADWPVLEHTKVAQVTLKSAASTQLDGALSNQNWNDHIADTTNYMGHLLHISEAIRTKLPATWASGTSGSVTIDTVPAPDAVYAAVTGGFVRQMHKQAFPALDMTQYTIDAVSPGISTFTISGDGDLTSTFFIGKDMKVHDSTGNDGYYTVAAITWSDPDFLIEVAETIPDATADGTVGDDAVVINDFSTAYLNVTDLSDITQDSVGGLLANSAASFVLWGIANKTGEISQLMINVPSGTYNRLSPDLAVNDASSYANYSIPTKYNGTGFLISRFTFQITAGGDWSLYNTEDLRGKVPNTTAGGGTGGGGVTEFTALTDTPSAYTGAGSNLVRVNAGVTALEFLDETSDFLSQYALLAGRAGGQTIIGGTAAAEDLTLASTSNGVKGSIIIEDNTEISGTLSVSGSSFSGPNYSAAKVVSYVLNSHAEVDTTGWATYKDAAQAKPVDGTAGTALYTTFTRSTALPLRGLGDFLITKSANNGQGEGASNAFYIAPTDYNSPITINFRAETSVNYADGDIGIYIYDIDNGALIEPTPINLQAGKGKFSASFQATDSVNYRIIFQIQTTNALAYTVNIDDVAVNTEAVVYGAPDVYLGALTTTGNWTTNTTYTGRYWRKGDRLLAEVTLDMAGAPDALTLNVNLPSGYALDTTKLSDAGSRDHIGDGEIFIAAGTSSGKLNATVITVNTTTVALAAHSPGAGTTNYLYNVTNTSPVAYSAGDKLVFRYEVPIAGWDSQVQMSETTMNREISGRFTTDAGNSIGNATATYIDFEDLDYAKGGANVVNAGAGNQTVSGSGWQFVVPESGRYDIKSTTAYAAFAVQTNSLIEIRVNDIPTSTQNIRTSTVSTNWQNEIHDTLSLVNGDIVQIALTQSSGVSQALLAAGVRNYISIYKVNTGTQTIATSEKVFVEGFGNGGTSLTASVTPIDFTETKDSRGAWSGNSFTAPKAGWYAMDGMIRTTTSVQLAILAYVGVTSIKAVGSDLAIAVNHPFNLMIYLNEGEVLTLRVDNPCTLDNIAVVHHIVIHSL